MYKQESFHQSFPDRSICIIGLGYVGLTLAVVMAECGFHVVGVEKRLDLLEKLKLGDPGFFEPGLKATLKRVISNKTLELYQEIPHHSPATVYIITVGTPIDLSKEICLENIINICETLLSRLENGDMVLLRSTVKLGTTRDLVLPLLQRSKKHFQLAFCPERTIEGQAMSELRYLPQIIGTDDLSTSLRASQLFQFITPTTIRLRDYETAEMIKLIDNTRRDVMFAFSNEIAKICDAVKINVNEVISAGRFGYSRTDLPIPGPVGGPCLSKDPHILVQSVKDLCGITPIISAAARKVNENQPQEIVQFLKSFSSQLKNFPQRPKISLMGIAFKGRPATDDIRGTTARPILDALCAAFPGATFWGYDPVISSQVIQEFGLIPKRSLEEALHGAHLVLILNNHPSFSEMPIESLAEKMARPGVVYDFWNCFSEELYFPEGVQYISLGNHQRSELNCSFSTI